MHRRQGLPVKLDSIESDDARAPTKDKIEQIELSGGAAGGGGSPGQSVQLPGMVPYVSQVVLGSFAGGFVDPVTGKQRRVPVETLRAQPRDQPEGVPYTGFTTNSVSSLSNSAPIARSSSSSSSSSKSSEEEDDEDEDEDEYEDEDDRGAIKNKNLAADAKMELSKDLRRAKATQDGEEAPRRRSAKRWGGRGGGSNRGGGANGGGGQLKAPPTGGKLVYTAARNSALFTQAPLLTSFRVPGAVGLAHPPQDANGASSDLFLLGGAATLVRDHEPEKGAIKYAVDGRYSVVGYVVRGLDLALSLQDGDIIDGVTVEYGSENLVRPPISIKDVFFGVDE